VNNKGGYMNIFIRAISLSIMIFIHLCKPIFSQSMADISIGDSTKVLYELGYRETGSVKLGESFSRKFMLESGNDLSVTYDRRSQKIVFLETDWNGNSSGIISDYPGFLYGKTTLLQIRQALGNNGYAYQSNQGSVMTEQGIALFNAYEISGNSNLVAVFICFLNESAFESVKNDPNSLSSLATLSSMILADRKYLDSIWGYSKIFDPNYQKISWPKIQSSVAN
jgi:hypothetical protein